MKAPRHRRRPSSEIDDLLTKDRTPEETERLEELLKHEAIEKLRARYGDIVDTDLQMAARLSVVEYSLALVVATP